MKNNQSKTTNKPNSKKHVVKKLWKNWRDDFFNYKLSTNENQCEENRGESIFATAICIATGLRPAELNKGIVFYKNDLDQIEIKIHGAKTSKEKNIDGSNIRGIEFRYITINPEFSAAARYLFHEASKRIKNISSNNQYSFSYNNDTLRDMLRKSGRSFFQKVKPELNNLSISAYGFRHAMFADLKSFDHLTPIDIAMAMGQASAKSINHYAKAFRKKGGNSNIKPSSKLKQNACPFLFVSASQVPRSNHINPFVLKSKISKSPKPDLTL